MSRIVKRMVYLAAFVYCGAIVLLVFLENRMVYPAPSGAFDPEQDGAECVEFQAADGTRLHGWFLNRRNSDYAIVYFHGNGEDVSHAWGRIEYLASRLNARVFLFDYRGYGHSEGSPCEAGLVADGLAAVQWTSQRTGLPAEDIVLIGRSLGGGVAAQVAAQRPPAALVLISTFSSMVDVAAGQYRLFPVRWLMRNRYDCQSALANFQSPLLQIHGRGDRIVPLRCGQDLFDSVPCRTRQFLVIEGRGHNNLQVEDFAEPLAAFLKSAVPPRAGSLTIGPRGNAG